MAEPKHGDERNRRQETTSGQPVEFVHATTGATLFTAPISSTTRSVVEKFCAGCNQWVEVKGVFGMIEWIATHDEHAKEV